jgi:hypothetical protein
VYSHICDQKQVQAIILCSVRRVSSTTTKSRELAEEVARYMEYRWQEQ